MNNFKVVMYHYVREYNKNIQNLNFFDLKIFEKQLDYFEKEFWFISRDDWIRFTNWEKVNLKWVLLTFDDWLSCHYKYVLPILKKRKLWWLFFINSWPLKNKKLLNVHKVHYLLWKYDIDELYNIYISVSNKLKIEINFNINNEYKHQNLDEKTLFFKSINYIFPIDIQNKILEEIFKYYSINEEELFEIFYMNKNQIKKLIKNWNLIWWHTENHILLSKYNENFLTKEILESNKYLEKEFNIKIKNFAIPYWTKSSYNDNILSILKNYWIKNNFIVENKDFIWNNNLKITRYDCNALKYWKFFIN